MHTYTHTHTHTHIHEFLHICPTALKKAVGDRATVGITYIHMHTYIYTYTHTHTHTHIHAYISFYTYAPQHWKGQWEREL